MPATKLVVRQSTVGSRYSPDVQRALQLVRERAGQGMRVADLARILAVSRSHLEQEFSRVLGHTPGEEIRRVRVQTAEDLLRRSNHTITEIAGMLGFERTGNFSEFFRKHVGMSPRAYRQSKRAGERVVAFTHFSTAACGRARRLRNNRNSARASA